ncbi:hypothetical protein DL96DRAFT_1816592 [Flagelloscypha sp. PMI_526]|nr:hypothetical protein DL96DRAFT_1816592 [Flagelloscypha sp. PMI_526]
MAEANAGVRVISFDGPVLDASGLSELFILEDIAGKWAWDREGDEREGGDVRVSELFDIVGGTGIGGFYAILFSLHMTVSQVIKSHKILQNVVFSSDEWGRNASHGCATTMKTALLQIVEEVGLDVDLDAPFLSNTSLKCFVCVLNDLNAGRARSLRNYRVRSSKSPHCSIREAIHATLADVAHLPPVYIQDEQFISASSSFANPSYELMKELPTVFPKNSKLSCFVNIGAGRPVAPSMASGGLLEDQAKRFLYAEGVAQNLVALCSELGPCYFRLSAATEFDSATEQLADGASRVVKSRTLGYLEEEEVQAYVDTAVNTLAQFYGVVPLERLGSLAAKDGRAKLNAQVETVHDHVVHIKRVMDNEIYRKIKDWLSPIGQTTKLDACIRSRSPSTCHWLWDHPRVIEWRSAGGIFWCHAGMGAGKTILMSHIVETLIKVPDKCFIAYYYFEFTNPSTLSEEALFRSVTAQLSHVNNIFSQQLYEQHRNGSLQPQLTTLHKFLHELVKGASLPVYIVIDALDELPLPGRKYLLPSLLELSSLATHGVSILVTSRDDLDIHESFSGKVTLDFPIEKQIARHDITNFVDRELSAKKWESWPKQEVQNIRNMLIKKADGMFRMVACQLEVLNQAQSTDDMRRALATLPATLSETYLYILGTIPSHLRSRAHALFCVLSAAFEPVSIEELSALVAVELGDPTDAVNLPVYRQDLCYHEPQNIIGLGTSLVRRTTRPKYNWTFEEEDVLELSHASVKEYLLQGSCSWCLLDVRLAHETTARACLALLIHAENLKHTSRAAGIFYTKNNWWKHIHSRHKMQLLSQQQKLFEKFPWTFSSIGVNGAAYRRLYSGTPLQSPLIFAAAANLEQLLLKLLESPFQWKADELNKAMASAVRFRASNEVLIAFIEKGSDINFIAEDGTSFLEQLVNSSRLDAARILVQYGVDVNKGGGGYGSALQAAAWRKALDAVIFFVESGADVNMAGGLFGSALQAAAWCGALGVGRFLVESGTLLSAWPLNVPHRALDVVKCLVERGAQVNMVGGLFGSALQVAAWYGDLDVVRFLIENDADVNMVGGIYGSALKAVECSDYFPITKKRRQEIVGFLVAQGAVRSDGTTPDSAFEREDSPI